MELSKNIAWLYLFFYTFCFSIRSLGGMESFNPQASRILFFVQQGDQSKGLDLYRQYTKDLGQHDFELLHQLGLNIVEQGFQQSDPESQVLALFGASLASHEEVYHILEESLKSSYPQIQLIALSALAQFQNDQADQALIRALSSNYLPIRLEALLKLCKKKHPQASSQAESLMYKTPKEILPLYPQLYAMIGNEHAIRILRKLLNNPSEKVRTATILSLAENGRDDLLPQIRQQAAHFNFRQQEACAYAFGKLKDVQSIAKLKLLARSQYPHVVLAAQQALYRLGEKEVISSIEAVARKEDPFAIAILGEIPESTPTLIELLQQSNLQVKLNAILALLKQGNPACFPYLPELLIRDKRDLAFDQIFSTGQALEAWKAIPSASQLLKNDIEAYLTSIELKEEILTTARKLSEEKFLVLADQILASQQNNLIPHLIDLLEEIATTDVINLLKKYQQKIGAPLIRNYCNLALYNLKEPGPYGDLLKQWVKSQNDQALIRFRPFSPWELGNHHYELTPEETSRLLIGAFESFTTNQDELGIEALIDAIQHGHEKNRYALAGLLIRATQ